MRKIIFVLLISVFYNTFAQTDLYKIHFYQSFDDNTPGPYLRSEWKEDWKPTWSHSDPREENWNSYGQLKIVAEGENKFFRREVKAGEISTGEKKGCNWYIDIDDVDEMYYSFKVRFPENLFTQNKHFEGKINGMYNPYSDKPVGTKPDPNTGFTTFMMFQNTKDFKNIEIFLYISYQEMRCNACAGDYPLAFCPDEYKLYYGNWRPVNFLFDPDKWYTITQRLVMNDPFQSNGIIEIFINNELIASYDDYRFRDTDSLKIEYLLVTSFFGGGPPVASEVDTYFDFDDFMAFTYKVGANVPRGTKKSTVEGSLSFR
ncbi:MAG: hypothetical protein HC906_11305 [Bacteroidales bacterium]|nr:hypothetical protein [Bacteroidales bacterium]